MNTSPVTFKKVVRPCRVSDGDVYASIELTDDGRLSISGVIGPTANGDARGSSGQWEMSFDQSYPPDARTYAPGWSADLFARFLAAWRAWHLNDMRAGCEHQRANWDTTAQLEIVTYRLNDETRRFQENIKRGVLERAQAGEVVGLRLDERAVLALPWEITRAPDADSIGSGRYEVHKRESKAAGWVYPKEHDGGLLMKPCEVCGYQYGSKWLREEVPAEVLDFLRSLPDADKACPWRTL